MNNYKASEYLRKISEVKPAKPLSGKEHKQWLIKTHSRSISEQFKQLETDRAIVNDPSKANDTRELMGAAISVIGSLAATEKEALKANIIIQCFSSESC